MNNNFSYSYLCEFYDNVEIEEKRNGGFWMKQSIYSLRLPESAHTMRILFETRARVFVDSQCTTLYVKVKMALIHVVSGV